MEEGAASRSFNGRSKWSKLRLNFEHDTEPYRISLRLNRLRCFGVFEEEGLGVSLFIAGSWQDDLNRTLGQEDHVNEEYSLTDKTCLQRVDSSLLSRRSGKCRTLVSLLAALLGNLT